MLTVVGGIFFTCALLCFLFKEDDLFGLLVLATVFEAASAINIAERGIQPYYIVAFFIILRALVNRSIGNRISSAVPQGKWLLVFGLVCVVSAIFFPRIFSGTPIYDPQIGIDDGLLIHPPLSYKISNLVQATYIAFHVATVFSILALRFSFRKTGIALLWAFYLEAAFVVAESLCQMFGISFPLSLVLNNPGYSLWTEALEGGGIRNPGTFAEPSLAGAFMIVFCTSFLVQYFEGKCTVLKPLLAILAVCLVSSSSSLLVITFVLVAVFIKNSPFRLPLSVNKEQLKRLIRIAVPIITMIVIPLLFVSNFQSTLAELTVGKGETGSFVNRTAADLFAIQLLFKTSGLGVGLGSSRASSLATTLLSNIGIAGTVSFTVFYCRLYVRLPQSLRWLKWAGFALLSNMCLGLADVTMPLFWMPVLLAVQLTVHTKSDGL